MTSAGPATSTHVMIARTTILNMHPEQLAELRFPNLTRAQLERVVDAIEKEGINHWFSVTENKP